MKITAITVYQVDLPLKEGRYSWSNGNFVEVFDSTIVEIDTDEGLKGHGECCPLGSAYLPSFARGVRAGLAELEVAVVRVHRRDVRVVRVQHQADPGREEAGIVVDGQVAGTHGRAGRGRQLAVDRRDVDAGLLEDLPVLQHAATAAAAAGALPRGLGEGGAVFGAHGAADRVLQLEVERVGALAGGRHGVSSVKEL